MVVANRLPVAQVAGKAGKEWKTSPGGLVSALAPIVRERDGSWVGWPGTEGPPPPSFVHEGLFLCPVGLCQEEIDSFYQGFSNSTLWPLYHDAVRWPEFHRHWWKPYTLVNERFARAAAEVLQPGDVAWVHDYHLQLVPSLLRTLCPDTRIGFFMHIPFPPVELFAQLPWRRSILEGLLGADLIGFQTKNCARNFEIAARRFSSARGTGSLMDFEGRRVRIDTFPISIDTAQISAQAAKPETARLAESIKQGLGPERRLILGVDRLDYTKGIIHRLRAFETLLERLEDGAQTVTFLQIAVPSRELVPQYLDIRTRIEQQVGHINGTWGTAEHVPVRYLYRSLPFEELVAHYLAADVMVVTPLRDGMNLVSKEYVATRANGDGVLVLSEFAGAANELTEAVLVNPHDIDGTATAMQEALAMPPEEVHRRMGALRRVVERNDVHLWADSFLGALFS